MIEKLNSQISELESYISDLNDKIHYAEKLLKKCNNLCDESIELSDIEKDFHKSFSEENIKFLDIEIPFYKLLKLFKPEKYQENFDIFISDNDYLYDEAEDSYYSKLTITDLLAEIADQIEQ